jgi:hypothetical protein
MSDGLTALGIPFLQSDGIRALCAILKNKLQGDWIAPIPVLRKRYTMRMRK